MPDRFQDTHIRQVPLFQQLEDHHFNLIAQAFEVRRYHVGDYVLFQGQPAPGMLIMVEGMAVWLQSRPDGQAQQVGTLHASQFIYQEALFKEIPNNAYLQVVRPATILFLSRQRIASLLAQYPDLKAAFGLDPRESQHLHKKQFKGQLEDEEVLLFTRRHWWAYIRWLWIPLLLMTPIWIIAYLIPAIAAALIAFSLVLAGIAAGYLYFEWANDMVIVTDQRVILITRTILTFQERRNQVALKSIQEANAEIGTFDIFARLFRYGRVELRTAGSQGNFNLDFMPDPESVQDLILEDARQVVHREQLDRREAMRADVERWVQAPYLRRDANNYIPQKGKREGVDQSRLTDVYSRGTGPLSPFVTMFKGDEGGTIYRKHWTVWLRMIFLPALMFIGTLVVTTVLLVLGVMQTAGVVGWGAALGTLIVSVAWFFFADWDWRHDYYLVTDRNIVIVNQRPLWIQNETDQVLLEQVDNVVAETSGILQQVLKFGDLRVSLVGADDQKLFDDVANPTQIQQEINARQQRARKAKAEAEARQQREMFGEVISAYHQHLSSDTPQPQSPQMPAISGGGGRNPSPFGQGPAQPRPQMSAGRPYQRQQPGGQQYQQPQQPYPQQQPGGQQYRQPQQPYPQQQPGGQQYRQPQQPYPQGGQQPQQPYPQGGQQYQRPYNRPGQPNPNPPLPDDDQSPPPPPSPYRR